jgi:hypothetical protein
MCVWLIATVVMYIERSEREAKDPHGSFAYSLAALVEQVPAVFAADKHYRSH